MTATAAAVVARLADASLDTAPYLQRMGHLLLAGALGLFVGMEREHSGKQAGLRTFGFVALLGCAGAIVGPAYGVASLALTGVLIAGVEVDAIVHHRQPEVTTMAALLVTCLVGTFAGQGHVLTPTTLAVVTAGLLAWKERLAGFTLGLTREELRSAILLAVLAFGVYPLLPEGSLGPQRLVDARLAWITVLLIAVIGFVNYILLKLYGHRGIELTGLLGGLVNSTVTATELSLRARDEPSLTRSVFRGISLSTAAMAVRNVVIVGVVAASTLTTAAVPLGVMAAGATVTAFVFDGGRTTPGAITEVGLRSPFSLTSALKFGVVFLALQVVGGIANNALGGTGFYSVAFVGGFVSSASTVGSAAALAANHSISPTTAGVGAVLASVASTMASVPIVARVSRCPALTRRIVVTFGCLIGSAAIAVAVQAVTWS